MDINSGPGSIILDTLVDVRVRGTYIQDTKLDVNKVNKLNFDFVLM